ADDLRYHAAETYPLLYAHLKRQAQRFLGSYRNEAFELDLVIGHVVEQLVRLGLLGGEDKTPLTALDHLTTAQFYAFLNHSTRNKAIDRLRKHRLQINSVAELEFPDSVEGEENPLNDAIESIWGAAPFATPEEATLELASQQELRTILKHCLKTLCTAPRQLQAMLQEAEEYGASALLQSVIEELHDTSLEIELDTPISHASQHKDHAHKKLRHCLQQKSSNLAVLVALRLTEYGAHSPKTTGFSVPISLLTQNNLSERDVRIGLKELTNEGLLAWHDEENVHFTSDQMKHLQRFYKE
ncbi:MAG: hypothetical protein M3Z24_05255, partial [Chloroflexota bacterium]|nr:hypothetical protein [Chloroflexota bacterium]